MPWEKMVSVLANIERMCSRMNRLPYLYITGDDPILHSRFWDLLELIHSHGIPFTLMGNPFHLNDAVCRRESSFEQMRAIGADHCIIDDEHLSARDYADRPNKLLELVGPRTLHDSLCTVSRPGYVCNTGILGNQFSVPQFDPIKYIPNNVFLTGFFSNYPTQQAIDRMMGIIQKANIKPLYSKVFSLNEIVEAHTLLERGGASGKIILKI